ncbi:hypothetical protein Tco_0623032 [Tanacetum coccineum]
MIEVILNIAVTEDIRFLALGWHLEEIHVTWGSFGEEIDKITDLHQIHEEVLLTERRDSVAGIKRGRRDQSSDGVWNLETASGCSQLKKDLESYTLRWRQDHEATPSELSGEEAWESIDSFTQGLKEWDKPFIAITKEELAILRAQIDELVGNKKENTPPVTYPDEVEKIIGIPIKVEPLDKTPLEDLDLNTCNHYIPLSSREIPSFDELEPQPKALPNCPSLDISLGVEIGPEPPIKPNSPDSFRMKVVDHLTIHTPHSPHMASFHFKDLYCYYHPCIDDPKKHY